jgi:putative oxidoreductase
MKYIALAARICLCLIFFKGGIANLLSFSGTVEAVAGTGLPFPALMAWGNIIFQLVGATLLLLGFKAKWGAVLLIIFLIPTTLIFHDFWVNPGEVNAFLKNVGLIGGLLMIIYAGAGALSIDESQSGEKLTSEG